MKKEFFKLSIALILLVGVCLRLCAFMPYRALWRDECSLALNIYFRSFADLWGVLVHTQSAPPIFMTVCKIFNYINPLLPEYFIRLFPLISGIAAVYLFYKLSKKIYESNLAIITANLMFAFNTQLIYYSHEFKQYSTDAAVVIGLLIYLSNLNISALSKRQLILHSFIIAIFPFLSLPSVFVIFAWLLFNFINKENFKKLFCAILPAAILNLIYYVYTLMPAKKNMMQTYDFLWQSGFLKLNLNSFLSIINENLQFFFSQCKFVFIPACLIFIGILIMIKRRNKFDKLILFTLIFVILASFMTIYPIKGRVSLYLLPILIIVINIPLAVCKQNLLKLINIILIILIIGNFQFKNLFSNNIEYSSTMMQLLKTNYKLGDFVIYNDVSDSQFAIYSYIQNFQILDNRIGKIQLSDYGEDWYYSVLDMLPKNNKYWFYYAYDIETKPVIPFLKNWAHRNGKILYEKEFYKKAYLLCIQL